MIEYHIIIPDYPLDHRDGFYTNLNEASSVIEDLMADDEVKEFKVRKLLIHVIDGDEVRHA